MRIAFAITFVVIASYWLAHHRLVAACVAIDRPTIIVNLVLIAAVVLLPFSTASVGDPSVADLPLPTVLMAVNVAIVSLLHLAVWLVVAHRGLLDHTPTPGERSDRVINGLATPAVFLISVPIAYLASPDAARLSWLALLAINPAVGSWTARARRLGSEG